MAGWLVLAAAAAVAVGVPLVRARFWPYGPCPTCQGRRGRSRGSTGSAWNRCTRCGGSGARIRPLARIYPRWREEHRKRTERNG